MSRASSSGPRGARAPNSAGPSTPRTVRGGSQKCLPGQHGTPRMRAQRGGREPPSPGRPGSRPPTAQRAGSRGHAIPSARNVIGESSVGPAEASVASGCTSARKNSRGRSEDRLAGTGADGFGLRGTAGVLNDLGLRVPQTATPASVSGVQLMQDRPRSASRRSASDDGRRGYSARGAIPMKAGMEMPATSPASVAANARRAQVANADGASRAKQTAASAASTGRQSPQFGGTLSASMNGSNGASRRTPR